MRDRARRQGSPGAGRRGARPALSLLGLLALAACTGEPREPCRPDPPTGALGSICGFRNPEDVEWVAGAGLLLVSEMAGRDGGAPGHLAALALPDPEARPDTPFRLWPPPEPGTGRGSPTRGSDCAAPPTPEEFAPHGIASARLESGPIRLVVVNHGRGERIEVFDVAGRGRGARLRWRGCIALPPGMVGNDLALAPDGTLAVTRYGSHWGGIGQVVETVAASLGRDTGEVRIRRPGSRFEAVPGTEGPSPNGVWLAPDRSKLLTAHTGAGRVVRVELAGGNVTSTEIPGHPDNLSLSPRGVLLLASHLSGVRFLRCAFGGSPCRSPWAVFEIDPDDLASREILRHDGSAVGAVASAAEAFGRLYLGAVFGDRIGVYPLPEAGHRTP